MSGTRSSEPSSTRGITRAKASYAQAARSVLPGGKLVKPYQRKVSVRVSPRRNSRIPLTLTGISDALVGLGLPENDLRDVFFFGKRSHFEISFQTVEGKNRFYQIMKKEEAKKKFEVFELSTPEYEQICVTRVPGDYPDINIRVPIERIGGIKIEGEGTVEVEKLRSGRTVVSGKRFYKVKPEAFKKMKELPQVMDLGPNEVFFVAYRGLPQQCLTCFRVGHWARDCEQVPPAPDPGDDENRDAAAEGALGDLSVYLTKQKKEEEAAEAEQAGC